LRNVEKEKMENTRFLTDSGATIFSLSFPKKNFSSQAGCYIPYPESKRKNESWTKRCDTLMAKDL